MKFVQDHADELGDRRIELNRQGDGNFIAELLGNEPEPALDPGLGSVGS